MWFQVPSRSRTSERHTSNVNSAKSTKCRASFNYCEKWSRLTNWLTRVLGLSNVLRGQNYETVSVVVGSCMGTHSWISPDSHNLSSFSRRVRLRPVLWLPLGKAGWWKAYLVPGLRIFHSHSSAEMGSDRQQFPLLTRHNTKRMILLTLNVQCCWSLLDTIPLSTNLLQHTSSVLEWQRLSQVRYCPWILYGPQRQTNLKRAGWDYIGLANRRWWWVAVFKRAHKT